MDYRIERCLLLPWNCIRTLVSGGLLMLLCVQLPSQAQGEERLLSEEVQCDFEVRDAYFIVVYNASNIAFIPAQAVPVRGEGDAVLVGGASWVVSASAQLGELPIQQLRAVLRGSGNSIKISTVKPPVGEDMLTLDRASSEVADALKEQIVDLRNLEAKSVQAQAALDRMRSQVDDISDINKLVELRGATIQNEERLSFLREIVAAFSRRREAVQREFDYPQADLLEGLHASYAAKFREAAERVASSNRKNTARGELSPEDKSTIIQLGRTNDPATVERQLAVLRAKTSQFEKRLSSLGIQLDTPPSSPEKGGSSDDNRGETEADTSHNSPKDGPPQQSED